MGNAAAGWVGGVPNQANITMPWRCQPVGECTLQNVSSCPAPVLDATLVCPDASCNATHVSLCAGPVSSIDHRLETHSAASTSGCLITVYKCLRH